MALDPVVIAISASGARVAKEIADALGYAFHGRDKRVEGADLSFENALDHIRDLFAAGRPVIGVCASGILIRAVAPLLNDKKREAPVIAVSEDGSFVLPLLGGHRGANRLSRDVANLLGAHAAVTTAGDVALGVALDEPPKGYRLANVENAKSVMSRLLSGAGVAFKGAKVEWLSDLKEGSDVTISVTETASDADLQFHPQNHALGVGCSRNCPPEELEALVFDALREKNISPFAISSVNTIDLKADEIAITALAKRLDVPLRVFSAGELGRQAAHLANPSEIVMKEVGCPGVCEAAALAQANDGAVLVVEKQKSAMATCALARSLSPMTSLTGRKRGRVALIGIGPGQSDWRTPEASRLVSSSDLLIGYGLYIDLLGPIAAGKPRKDFPLGAEEERCRAALELAAEGQNVAIICSGDAGIYAMGALVYELLDRPEGLHGVSQAARRVEVITAPGISALQAAAARGGAPLGHDFCAISLSDLLTPREDILRRIEAAAIGQFVIAFYNPVSQKRRHLLEEARAILLKHRPADCPVLLAQSLGRTAEKLSFRTLEKLDIDEVDMLTVVIIGSDQSRLLSRGDGARIYTPRGYARKIDGDPA